MHRGWCAAEEGSDRDPPLHPGPRSKLVTPPVESCCEGSAPRTDRRSGSPPLQATAGDEVSSACVRTPKVSALVQAGATGTSAERNSAASQRTLERREVASLPSRRNARSPSGRLDSAGAAGPVPSPTTLIFAARCSLPALAGGAPSKSAESRLTRKQHAAAKAGDPGIRREPRSWSALAYKRSRRGPPEPLARASWSAPIVVT